jgi:RecA/RadA recombinase
MSLSKTQEAFLKQLRKYEDTVDHSKDMLGRESVLRSTSPYVNWTFGIHGGGLPRGLGLILYGPPKAGKSLIAGSFMAGAHAADPEALVIKFNTEMRGQYQKTNFLGVDQERLVEFDTNEPDEIFNRWNNDIVPMLKNGMKVGLTVFDSLNGIRGIKGLDAEDVSQHLIGDKALTLGTGFEMILSSFRRFKIPYIATTHVRANIDTGPQAKYAPKEKMAAPYAIKHMGEFFMSVQRGTGEDARVDSAGNALVDEETKDARGNVSKAGHKIFLRMEENSLGVHGRAGQFIVDFKKGLVDVEGQVTEMAIGCGMFDQGGSWFSHPLFPNGKVNGKKAVAEFFRANPGKMVEFVEEIYARDAAGIRAGQTVEQILGLK